MGEGRLGKTVCETKNKRGDPLRTFLFHCLRRGIIPILNDEFFRQQQRQYLAVVRQESRLLPMNPDERGEHPREMSMLADYWTIKKPARLPPTHDCQCVASKPGE
jgi:hypothetical protein